MKDSRSVRWLGRDTVRAPYLTLCLSSAEFRRVARQLKVEDPGTWKTESQVACVHTWENAGRLCCIVCIDPAEDVDPIDMACMFVHEAVHVFQRLCDSIGESQPSREFEAYSIERISEQLMREYVRRMTGKR